MKLAVILNIKQAKLLVQSAVPAELTISFCPTATYYLREQHYTVTSTSDDYRAFSHGRVVAILSRELGRICNAISKQYNLNTAESEGLQVYLYHYLACAYHLHFSLRKQRNAKVEFIWVSGENIKTGTYDEMFASLAMQPSPVIMSYAYYGYSFTHYLLTSFYNKLICFLVMRSKRVKIIDYGDELPKRIIQAMLDNGEKLLVLNTQRVGKNMLLSTRFFIKSILHFFSSKPVYLFRTSHPADYHVKMPAFSLSKLYSKDVLKALGQAIEVFIPFIRTEVRLGKKIIEATRPHVAVSDHAKYGYILGGLEVMKEYGGKHAMLNHGTHTIQHTPISKTAALLWGKQQRIINENTTHSLPKSPLTAELTREIRADGYQLSKVNVYGKIHNKATVDGKFVILHAGNYTDVFNHIPWCKETADEYLLAIIELLEEVEKLDNVELIIKLKNKKSATHKAIVEEHIRRLGIADKARVDTTSKFRDLMARAHIVVCNLSGTIEEALANHIPVMIHTFRKSYFHIAEDTVQASSINGLAPAYLIKERADISRIITMLDKNREKITAPLLFTNVAWQADELMTIQSFSKALFQDITS